MALQPADYALVIGIDDYPKYNALKGPIEDAKRMADWLGNQDTGGGVPELNQKLVLSKPPADQGRATPVQEDIDEALAYLFDRAQKENPPQARRFYFYFAGHGLGLNSNEVGLCMPSWSDIFRSNTLMVEAYLKVIQDSGLFQEIFFFLDCCRVRKINAEGHKPNIAWPKPANTTGSVQYLIGFATEYQNVAYEAEMESAGTDESQVRGLFTTALLETLNNAAVAQPEGGVSLAQLCSSVNLRTTELAKAINPAYNQEPRFRVEFRESEKTRVVFGSVKPKAKVVREDGLEAVTAPQPQPFQLNLPYPRETEVAVFDWNGREMYRGFDNWKGDIPAGNVTVQTNHFGKVDRHVVPHRAPGSQFDVPAPQLFTATLVAGAVTSHEYLTGPAEQFSRTMTHNQPLLGDDSGLFLFLRYTKWEHAKPGLLLEHFQLLDENLRVVGQLEEKDSQHDQGAGWQAFSALVRSGQYYLQYKHQPSRLIPVYLFPGWQTQLFLLFSAEQPLFESLRMMMARLGAGFHAQEDDNRITDLAHQCLSNVRIPFPPEMLERLLYGKFENPVFGLLGAYLMLQRPSPESLQWMDTVIANLERLLQTPDNPDLTAIKLLAGRKPAKAPVMEHPPMFGYGTEGVIRLDIEGQVDIPDDSAFQRMSDQRQSDLVFTSWETTSKVQELGLESAAQVQPWVIESLRELMERTQRNHAELTIRQIGQSLRMPEHTVRHALATLSTNAADDMRSGIDQLLKTGKMQQEKKPKVFVISTRAADDQLVMKELVKTSIQPLVDQGIITHWDRTFLIGGDNTMQITLENLQNADIVLGLLSADYFVDKEFALILHEKVHEMTQVRFMPVLVNYCNYKVRAEFKQNVPFPRDNADAVEPIMANWGQRQKAYLQIGEELMRIVEKIKAR